MPIIKSAIKRMKQTSVRRERNIETKKAVKAATRAFTDTPSFETLSKAQSAIDTAVKKNILNKGTAARRKSNLSKLAKEAGVKIAPAKEGTPKVATPKKAPAKKTAAKTKTKTTTAKKTASKK